MDLIKALNISADALKAQGTRLRVIAENVANADSTAQRPGGEPYRRRVVTFSRVLDHELGVQSVEVDGITLDLRPGQGLALVGENGSGKTTLIKLLARLYHPTSGRITLDGQDLREWDERALRRRISVVFQDFARYQMLVGENVGAGDVERFDDSGDYVVLGGEHVIDLCLESIGPYRRCRLDVDDLGEYPDL